MTALMPPFYFCDSLLIHSNREFFSSSVSTLFFPLGILFFKKTCSLILDIRPFMLSIVKLSSRFLVIWQKLHLESKTEKAFCCMESWDSTRPAIGRRFFQINKIRLDVMCKISQKKELKYINPCFEHSGCFLKIENSLRP